MRIATFLRIIFLVFFAAVSSAAAQAGAPPAQSSTSAGPTAAQQAALDKAEHLYRTGKLDAAVEEYKRVIQTEPNSPLAYAGLVHVYIKLKKPPEAYAAAAKAVELAPTSDAARTAMGEAYFRQGKIGEAEAEFTALIKAGTKQPRAYLGLANVYWAASGFYHAKLAIDRAYQLDPGDPDIRRDWIHTLGPKERLKALQAYLAGESNDDDEDRQNLVTNLALLQDAAGRSAKPCRLASKLTSMETVLEPLLTDPRHIRGYGLRVKLNGASAKLLLDTGAGGILVDRKIAEKAGIKRVVQHEVKGIGDTGGSAGYVGYADSISIAGLEFQDCIVHVLEKNSLIDEDGLIGADVFSRFLVDLDFPNSKFRISPLPARPDEPATTAALESGASETPIFRDRYIAPEMRSFTPVLRFGHDLIVWTKINDMAPRLFLLDTGAFSNAISPDAAREFTKVTSESEVTLKGLSGKVQNVFSAQQVTLQFAHLRQKNLDIIAFDTKKISDSIGTEIAGFLGFSMLRMLRIKIDYRDGLIDFEYDKNRYH